MSITRKNALDTVKFAFVTASIVAMPLVAMAADAEAAAPVDPEVLKWKYASAAGAMAFSALGASYAQAKIGAAAAGTLAERPEVAPMLLVLEALPEIIVLLGFVSALIISA